MNTAYCIFHEEIVALEPEPIFGHLINRSGFYPDTPPEIEFCDFPEGWATCPPPQFDMDDFINTVAPPSNEELAIMDLEALYG